MNFSRVECSVEEIKKSLEEAETLVNWLLTKCAIQQAGRHIIPAGYPKQKLQEFQLELQRYRQNPNLSRASVS